MAGDRPPMRMAVKDRDAFERSLRNILEWDFDRLVVAHGAIVPANAKEVFRETVARAGFSL